MIYTISLQPYIEKRVRGELEDDLQFSAQQVRYNPTSVGLKVSTYLQHFHIENKAAFLCGSECAKQITSLLKERHIDSISVETNAATPYKVSLIDNDETRVDLNEQNVDISEAQLRIFGRVLSSSMDAHSVCVLACENVPVTPAGMHEFYMELASKSDVMICDVHPDYYPMFAHREANVLLVQEEQLKDYITQDNRSLSDIVSIVSTHIKKLAKIVIYGVSSNDFILFVEDEVHRVVCSVKQPCSTIFKEALLAGVVKCYHEDGDLHVLCKECITMSVATSLSDGLFIGSEKVLQEISEKISIYKL